MKKMLFLVVLTITILSCDFVRLPPKEETIHRYLTDLSFIPIPRNETSPMTLFEHFEFRGNIVWTNQDGNFVSGNFSAGNIYTAEIMLVPKEGFTFDHFEETFIHREAIEISQTVATTRALIQMEFPRVQGEQEQAVTFTMLTGERLKAFYLKPDPNFMITLDFSGQVSMTFWAIESSVTRTGINRMSGITASNILTQPSQNIIFSGTIQTGGSFTNL